MNPLHAQVLSLPALIETETWRLEDSMRKLVPTPVQHAIRQIFLTGCGDSAIAAQAAEHSFRSLTAIPTVATGALDLSRYILPTFDHGYPHTPFVLAVSNSGEVARVVEAAKQATAVGGTVVGLTAQADSRLGEASDYTLDISAPTMPSSPGMRTYVMPLIALNLFAIRFAEVRGRITMDQAQAMRGELAGIGSVLAETLAVADPILKHVAGSWKDLPAIEFLGSGPNRGSAAFGAAKVLEATGQSATDIDLEEFVHLQYFERAARQIGTVVIAPPKSPSSERAVEVGRFLNTLERPWISIGAVDDSPVAVPLPEGVREEFAPIIHAGIVGLLASHLMDATNSIPGRGSIGQWSDSLDGGTTRNSTIASPLFTSAY